MSGRSVGDELTPNPSQHKSLRVIAQVTPCRVSAITLYISRTHPCLTTPEPYISITPLLKSIRRDGFILVFNKQYNKCYCFENFSHECISRGIQKSLIIPSDGQPVKAENIYQPQLTNAFLAIFLGRILPINAAHCYII